MTGILRLYRAGVLSGSDALGTFHPDRPISRAETAAIVSRVAQPGRRATGKTYGGTYGAMRGSDPDMDAALERCSGAEFFMVPRTRQGLS